MFSRVVAALVVAVGALVLLGWALDVGVLKSVLPGFVTMKANTALAFALCGAALWWRGGVADRAHMVLAQVCAGVVVLGGLLTLGEYVFGWKLGIDEALFRDLATVQTSHPGRPSPATAFNFILLGAALLLSEVETRGGQRPAQWLLLAVFVDALIAILGYSYGVQELYRVSAYSSMALHTAVLFVLIPVGWFCARPERGWMRLVTDAGPGGTLVRGLLPAAILVPPIMGGLRLIGHRAGYFEFEFGLALSTASNVLVYTALVWWTAQVARRATEKTEWLASFPHRNPNPIVELLLGSGVIRYLNPMAQRLFPGIEREGLAHPLLVGVGEAARPIVEGSEEKVYREVKVGTAAYAQTLNYIRETNCLRVYSADITERRNSEEQLRASLKEVRDLETALDEHAIVAITDPQGRITFVNDKFCAISKYSREELLGQDHRIINSGYHPAEFIRDLWTTITHGRVWHGEMKNRAKDGSFYWVDTTIVPLLNDHGKLRQFVAIRADITERKRQEEALKHLNEALERSNVELQQFAYIASHDLQTPLRNISGFVQLLQENYADKLDEQACDWIRRAIHSTEQMHALIRDVLEYSHVDSRARPYKPVPLREVFHDVAGLLETSIRDAGGKVTCDELPTVMGDRSQMVQLMQNLIGNGLKYHGEKPPHVHVSAQHDAKEWTISIRDNGIGIAPRHHGRIFEIFRRLHNRQEYPGTGIGLAVCRRIVHRHGGKIWVESQAGSGSVFHFTIAKKP